VSRFLLHIFSPTVDTCTLCAGMTTVQCIIGTECECG
jgi:hypothetical protein